MKCPCCDSAFVSLKAVKSSLCPGCGSTQAERLLWSFLENKTEFFVGKFKVLHIGPSGLLKKKFGSFSNLDYTAADFIRSGEEEILELPFDDCVFDVAICQNVFEYVKKDVESVHEVYRVLKVGGWAASQSKVRYGQRGADEGSKIGAERKKKVGLGKRCRVYGGDYPLSVLGRGGFVVMVGQDAMELEEEYDLDRGAKVYHCVRRSWEANLRSELKYHREHIGEGSYKEHALSYGNVLKHFGVLSTDFKGKSVLDVGCGPISVLYWITDAKRRVAIDPLAEEFAKLTNLKKMPKGMAVEVGRAEKMRFKDASFDCVFAFNGIDHWEDWKKGIKEIHRVLKSGGQLLMWVNLDRPFKSAMHPLNVTAKTIDWIKAQGFSCVRRREVIGTIREERILYIVLKKVGDKK